MLSEDRRTDDWNRTPRTVNGGQDMEDKRQRTEQEQRQITDKADIWFDGFKRVK